MPDPAPSPRRVRDLFDQALALPGPQREPFIRDAAAGDTALADEVIALLAGVTQAPEVVVRPLHTAATVAAAAEPAGGPDVFRRGGAMGEGFNLLDAIRTAADDPRGHPAQVGSYRIIRPIDDGGFGVVYLAEQASPRREVALKLIKPELGPGALRRFADEARMLARLQHPGIAQIYEAGMAAVDGRERAYFAMEYIKGVRLDQFVTSRPLGTRDRLRLLANICHAVHHAHQKGIVHRDLKPANILVEDAGNPKVIDFGVARLTDRDVQATTRQTRTGDRIGTLYYMSPEQIAGDPDDIDTRSDVYALGVIGYELLAGKLPYEPHDRSEFELARAIRDDTPSRLSSISRTFRGDIETIIDKAIAKEKDRRYSSASALAADIERFLRDEPITARPTSRWYQTRKFASRNKALVGGVMATLAALTLGTIGSTIFAARADQQRRIAEQRLRIADFQAQMLAGINVSDAGAGLMRDIAQRFDAAIGNDGISDDERSRRLQDFRVDLGRVSQADVAAGLIDATVLKPALQEVDARFREQPLVRAILRGSIAHLYAKIGRYADAAEIQTEVLSVLRRLLSGPTARETLAVISGLGIAQHSLGRLAESEALLNEALATRRATLGDDHPDTITSMNELTIVLQSRGEFDRAATLAREAAERAARVLGEADDQTLVASNNLATAFESQGHFADAEAVYRRLCDVATRQWGEETDHALRFVNNLGSVLVKQGKVAEAESCFRRVAGVYRRIKGERHLDTIRAINNLGQVLHSSGRLDDAEEYLRTALKQYGAVVGPDHPETLTATCNMGNFLRQRGDMAGAEPYLVDALARRRRVLGQDHPDTLVSLNSLGLLYSMTGRTEEAERCFVELVERSRRALGDDHPDTLTAMNSIASLKYGQGKLDEAEPLWTEALDRSRRTLGDAHPNTLGTVHNLTSLLRKRGELVRAEELLTPAVGIADQILPPTHPTRAALNRDMVRLFEARHKAEPAAGYDKRAAEWQARFDALTSAPGSK